MSGRVILALTEDQCAALASLKAGELAAVRSVNTLVGKGLATWAAPEGPRLTDAGRLAADLCQRLADRAGAKLATD